MFYFNKTSIAFFALLSATISYAKNPASDFSKHFEGMDGCFILYDLKNDKQIAKYNEKRCAERQPACSTFKVPLAIMAFDKGILKDEQSQIKWDGVRYEKFPAWNQDQTAASWMKNSVVWFSQVLSPKLGKETIEKYLTDFGYGNHDMSGGIKDAWLTPEPNAKNFPKNTLKISPNEQLEFFKKIWRGKLPVSKHALDTTKKILFIEKSPKGYELSGKTGSGFFYPAKSKKIRVGAFIAHVSKGDEEFIVVTALTGGDLEQYAGPASRDKMKAILQELGYW